MEDRFYNHVVKLDDPAVEGLLYGTVTYSVKLDGTNSSLRWDTENNCIAAYSRNRRLSEGKDNAGFFAWANSDDEEATFLRNFLFMNPDLILYGEWMGSTKFVGHIRDYDACALGKMWLFDCYNVANDEYYRDYDWRFALDKAWNGNFPWYIPYGIIENPTMEDIEKLAEDNYFLLSHANHPGEGIVFRRADFRNKYGRYEIGKYVRPEYKQDKSKPKPAAVPGEVEQSIVNLFVTDEELAKAKAKVILACNLDEFDNRNNKCIGMFLNMVFNDAIVDEMASILKKLKNPTINFKSLQSLCNSKARSYIGL